VKTYTVHQVARMAQVSVRTLHYYDQIGLLRPQDRTDANYRLYAEDDLLQLQQILFYRELGVPLGQIGRILADPGFDRVQALHDHRARLEKEAERILTLLTTVDRTLLRLTEKKNMLTDEELYEGLGKEKGERYEREAMEQYDPAVVAESNRRIRRMSKEQWNAVKKEGDDVNRQLAALMDQDPGSPAVQAAVAWHHAWIENFFPAPAAVYRGLGDNYASNDEFRATFDGYRAGLADFLQKAMSIYADRSLK
jgi:MerR family transcriptional regulator, thiopeptide resistance regulator